jgi:hypothetical protein
MAIDPTEIAEQQEQQQRINIAGAPKEFAKGPDREGEFDVAFGAGGVLKLLSKLDSPSAKPTTPVDDTGVVKEGPRVPTPQEKGLVQDGQFSETATKRSLAPKLMSPEGVEKFESQGLKAPAIGEEIPINAIQDAQQALDQEALDAEALAVDVNKEAQKAMTAQARGYKAETAIADETKTDEVLTYIASKETNIKALKDGGDFSFDFIDTDDDVKKIITAIGEVYSDETVARTRGKISNNVTMNEAHGLVADEIGFSRSLLDRKIGDRPLTAAEFVGARELLVKSAARLEELARLIKAGGTDAATRLKFRRQLAIHTGIQLQLKGAQTEAARALQSFQIKVTGEMDATRFSEEAQRVLNESGAGEITEALADRLLKVGANGKINNNYMEAINDFTRVGSYAKSKRMVHEAYLAGLLSSPATQFKNFIGTASFMLFQLPTEIVAGVYGDVIRAGRKQLGMQYPISEDQVYVEDAFLRVKGWSDAFGDALKAASIAWRTEMPAGASKLDVEQYAATVGESNSFFSKSLDELGKRMRIPFRLLLAADEFTKTISQRGEFYTLLNKRYQHALRNGMTEQQASDEAAMLLLDPTAVADDLNHKARFDTLQSDLGFFGQITGRFQRTFFGRFILPFATAPTNALLRTMEYTPFSKTAIDLLGRNGPQKQQLAMGKLTLGSAILFKTQQAAMDGKITGGFPETAAQRNALPRGWQPYSFVLRGEGFPEGKPLYDQFGVPNGPLIYMSYAGFEPVGGLLAISADTIQRLNNTNDPGLRNTYIGAAAIATAEYYKELPMLQGISDTLAFFEGFDPAKLARSYAENSTIVPGLPHPLSSLQRMFARLADPTKTQPKDDFEYYTLDDVMEQYTDDDGVIKYFFEDSEGKPRLDLVGMPRTEPGRQIYEFWTTMNALRRQDTFYKSERDLNAIRYDTFGEPLGSDEFSFAKNPIAAIFGNVTGLRLKTSGELQNYEKEILRLHDVTGDWPLTNPESYKGVPLTYGMQSDLVNLAKNTVRVRRSGYGDLSFKETLAAVIMEPSFEMLNARQRVTLFRKINNDFIDAGFLSLIELPEYANMRQAFLDRQSIKEQQKEEDR